MIKILKITSGLALFKNITLIVEMIKNPHNFKVLLRQFDGGLTMFFLVMNGIFKVNILLYSEIF